MPDLTLIISEEGEYMDIYGTTDALLYKSQSDLINKKINHKKMKQQKKLINRIH